MRHFPRTFFLVGLKVLPCSFLYLHTPFQFCRILHTMTIHGFISRFIQPDHHMKSSSYRVFSVFRPSQEFGSCVFGKRRLMNQNPMVKIRSRLW